MCPCPSRLQSCLADGPEVKELMACVDAFTDVVFSLGVGSQTGQPKQPCDSQTFGWLSLFIQRSVSLVSLSGSWKLVPETLLRPRASLGGLHAVDSCRNGRHLTQPTGQASIFSGRCTP
jgi:hypothetical protein